MRLSDLDAAMRVFETAHDHCVLPGVHMVARIDGRNFTRLTREICRFEAPYDEVFRDHMVETGRHLMTCGFQVVYGYTQSDEISLLLALDESAFNRKLRKLISVLAGEASASFTHRLGRPAAFDARIAQLPGTKQVIDYFRWRAEDAYRNALNGHCYWQLRREGHEAAVASRMLAGMSTAAKNELLFERGGINFNELPVWQRRGIGLYRQAEPPRPGATGASMPERDGGDIFIDWDLPMKDAYERFLATRILPATGPG